MFCFDHTYTLILSIHFFVRLIGHVSEIARPKYRAPRKKFVHPWILNRLYLSWNQVVSTLVLIYFSRLWPGHTIKTNCITFQTVDSKVDCWRFYRRVFSTTLCVRFLKKIISHFILFKLNKFHCLVAFTSSDIGQNVYYHYLFLSLWRHKFWI